MPASLVYVWRDVQPCARPEGQRGLMGPVWTLGLSPARAGCVPHLSSWYPGLLRLIWVGDPRGLWEQDRTVGPSLEPQFLPGVLVMVDPWLQIDF